MKMAPSIQELSNIVEEFYKSRTDWLCGQISFKSLVAIGMSTQQKTKNTSKLTW